MSVQNQAAALDSARAMKLRIAELEAERDQWKQAAERVVKDSLTTAPHYDSCNLRKMGYGLTCDCFKAALARIPEAKP